jgi:site-specific DNA-methyltransferase (adenine-specific)
VLITDPPYCLLTRRRKGGDLRDPKSRLRKLDDHATVTRFENIKEYELFTKEWMSACIPNAISSEANMIIWTNYLGKAPIITVASTFGFKYVGEYQWCKHTKDVKTPFSELSTNEHTLRVYEVAVVLTRSQSILNCHRGARDPTTTVVPWSVITGYHAQGALSPHPHPCFKPFEALEPLIRTWSKPG